MSNHETEPLIRCHNHLYARDLERIEAIAGKMKRNKFVRQAVRVMLNQIEARAKAQSRPITADDLDV
jgi:hypothetical protein